MNAVTAVRTPELAPVTAAATGAVAAKAPDATTESDQVFGPGLGILQLYMRMLNRLASDHHEKMKMHGEIANEAQQIVTAADALIAEIDSQKEQGKTVKLSKDLQTFLKDHPECREGVEWGGGGGWWNKKELFQVRGLIQKYATQHSDANSRVQLEVQKTMQTYNVTVGLMNSLQTMLGDMTKQFAQAIR